MASYDLLIKGGHVIDAANGIDEVMDVGIAGRVVAGVEKDIPESQGRRVIDATGKYVTPGLIDLHAHTAVYSGAMFPEEMCFPYGVTTMVDCGGSGWRTFDQFNDEIIKKSAVRVFALLNIVGKGMDGDVEQDIDDMDAELTAAKIRQRSDIIVGVKVAHFQGKGWESIDRGVKAARLSDTFVLVDQNAKPTRTFEDMLKRLRPGDGTTHCFGYGKPMIGNDGKVKQHYIDARKRGIKFDVGHGNNSFSFSMAKPALDQGFPPDTISTDMHRSSLHTSRAQMTEVMSKFLAMGMPMAEVVARSTWEPAKWINHTELGTLTPGALADVTILEFQDRPAGLSDSGPTGYRIMKAEGRLINQVTIKDGIIRFDYDGLAKDDWAETPTTDLNLP
ncbi:amidohydrolase/deacetylase family metallohydrolase [Candidatus Lucifugimonas marina]|jgi:dihydroorotase|uniref:Amidohydrolase family protein n=1 Tax=Candidatus Lucifugimonas marina TaxID=3038979 RepID=A0AAJ5ZG39_9CHLR|nr:amidohydrolase family protein [SAR202 cluster bacterium JH702]MDG0870870.1 amidohydrolase family protein [SAR202 cluster bacterium JH639]WFG34758.1 amidohydrolase family protein [SAR202 cluster bacterium JH545]WFG38685.1 amidohydrolase family protein [SAR202 cluster bacterium JH1073]